MNQIFEIISTDIQELKSLVTSNDIITKIQVAERLAINSFTLAEEVARAHEEANSAEYLWKSSITAQVANSEGSLALREANAKNDNRGLYKDYTEKYNYYKKSSFIMGAAQTVIEQSRQSISYLKQEYSHR